MSSPREHHDPDSDHAIGGVRLLDAFTHASIRELAPQVHYGYGARHRDAPLPLPSHVPEAGVKRVRSILHRLEADDMISSRTVPVCAATLREDGPAGPVFRWSSRDEEGWLHGELTREVFEGVARRLAARTLLAEAPTMLRLYTRLRQTATRSSNPADTSAFAEAGLNRSFAVLSAEWDELDTHPPRTSEDVREWFNSSVTSTRLHLARRLLEGFYRAGRPAGFMTFSVDRDPLKPHALYDVAFDEHVAVYFGGCLTAHDLVRLHRHYCDSISEFCAPRYEVW